jgi:hypothetical protein
MKIIKKLININLLFHKKHVLKVLCFLKIVSINTNNKNNYNKLILIIQLQLNSINTSKITPL